MNLPALVLLACGLAVDSWLVALVLGIADAAPRLSRATALAVTLGAFQGGMLAIGWLLGAPAADWLGDVSHWVACGVLTVLGVKMMRDDAVAPNAARVSSGWTSLALAGLATSIDALTAGFVLALGGTSVALAAALTATATACGAFLAYLGGKRVSQRAGRVAHVTAGGVLIAIGLLIVYQHTSASDS